MSLLESLGSRRRMLAAIAILAATVWIGAAVAFATARWGLLCKHGRGIDCLQDLPGSARASAEPARTIGFFPLTAGWTVATALLFLCTTAADRWRSAMAPASRRDGGSAAVAIVLGLVLGGQVLLLLTFIL